MQIVSYRVERLLGSYDPASSDKWAVVGQELATTLTITGMPPATSYFFKVTAISTVGPSEVRHLQTGSRSAQTSSGCGLQCQRTTI